MARSLEDSIFGNTDDESFSLETFKNRIDTVPGINLLLPLISLRELRSD